MAKLGRDYNYRYVDVLLHEHLSKIRHRLIADVQPYVDYVQQMARKTANQEHGAVGVGNFAMIRLLTPIIETVADAQGIKAQELLEKLEIKAPYLYWSVFRDVFSHSDEFEYAYLESTNEEHYIQPAIGIAYPNGSGSHTIHKEHGYVMLTVTKLYYDLVIYIEDSIKFTENRTIKIKCGVEYFPDKKDEEVLKISDEIINILK